MGKIFLKYLLIFTIVIPSITIARNGINNFKIDVPKNIIGTTNVHGQITLLDSLGRRIQSINDTIEFRIDGEINDIPFKNGAGDFNIILEASDSITFVLLSDKDINESIFIRKLPPILSLIPPLIAIILAIVFKEVIFALLVGIFIGILLVIGIDDPLNWLRSPMIFIDTYILEVFSNKEKTSVIIFSMIIGGMVSLIMKNGGMHKLIEKFTKFIKSKRNTMFTTWIMGIVIFFDDYANTLIVGNSLRPLSDKFKISREKLAYLVDSTAAPVASIALITTWIGAQLNYINDAVTSLPINESPYLIFLNSLGYAFYPLLTLLFIFFLIYTKKDFGSMLKAERLASMDFKRSLQNHENVQTNSEYSDNLPTIAKWYDAIIPVISLIIVALIGLFYTGIKANPEIWSEDKYTFWFKVLKVIGDSDSFKALLWASFFALGIAIIITRLRGSLNLRKSVDAVIDGFKSMLLAIIILILAWTLAFVIEDLHTATYLSDIASKNIPVFMFSTIVFIISAVISFATGSSWGTMALLYPIILPTAFFICQNNELEYSETMRIFYQVVAGVLGGSVFGDHCSPISDTTILSSLASKCNHIRHVKTQLPYALTVGLVSTILGYLFVSVTGLSPIWGMLLCACGLLAIILIFGKEVSKSDKVQ